MSTFFLRPLKITVPYLSKSPNSVISDAACQISQTELQQYHADVQSEVSSYDSKTGFENSQNFAETGTPSSDDCWTVKMHKNTPAGSIDGQTRPKPKKRERRRFCTAHATESALVDAALLRLQRRRLIYGYNNRIGQLHETASARRLQDPLALLDQLERSFALRSDESVKSILTTLNSSPSTTREHVFKGDIIVCIRDEFKPPVENLVRAYPVSAELLRHTMDYFRLALQSVSPEQEARGIQISLYVQKDLWEWLLQLAKLQYLQTRATLPAIQTSLALPLFSTAILLGIPAGREICLEYLKKTWPAAILQRDRSLEHVTENGVAALAQEVDPDYIEQSSDHSDWIVEKFYAYWVQDLLAQESFKEQFFANGTAKEAFMCVYCRKWMNPQLSSLLPCYFNLVLRRNDGLVTSIHSKATDSNMQFKVDELKQGLGTWRAVFWSLYGLLNVLRCADCDEVFQLAEIGHCRCHPCDPEPRPDSPPTPLTLMIYPCCQRPVSRVDRQKSTGCGFKDHRVECALLDTADKLRHQRLLTFQRFMWISPRQSAENLSASSNPAFLSDDIKNAVQDLVAAAWDASKLLWSNQDCVRQEEKTAMKLLKEYFRGISQPSPVKQAAMNTSPATEESQPAPVPLPEIKDPVSARTQPAKLGEQATVNKIGPFSGRNRYVPNLILPAYRGVFTRIHDEWKVVVDALIDAEKDVTAKASNSKELPGNDSKLKTVGNTRSAAAGRMQTEGQKATLRKVPKPPGLRNQNQSHGLFSSAPGNSAIKFRLTKQRSRTAKTQKPKPRSGRRIRPIKLKHGGNGPGQIGDQGTNQDWLVTQSASGDGCLRNCSSDTGAQLGLTSSSSSIPAEQSRSPSIDSLMRLGSACLFHQNQAMTSHADSNEQPNYSGDSSNIWSNYALRLVRKLNPPVPLAIYSDEENFHVRQSFLCRVQDFLRIATAMKDSLFSETWCRLRRKQARAVNARQNLLHCSTDCETKRLRVRTMRMHGYIMSQQRDAFAQPNGHSSRGWDNELECRRLFLRRCSAESDAVWRRTIKKLWLKMFSGDQDR